MLLLALLACTGADPDDSSSGADDTGVPATPSAPFVGGVAHLPHGTLTSSCTFTLELYASGEATPTDSVSVAARGGEWIGFTVPADGMWTVTGRDADCIDTSDGEPYTSSAFSVTAGQAVVWWWKSTSEGLATLAEAQDYERGVALVSVDEGSPADQLADFAAGLGVTVEATETADTYLATFAADVAVPAMLAQLSAYDRFSAAEPVWLSSAPGWW